MLLSKSLVYVVACTFLTKFHVRPISVTCDYNTQKIEGNYLSQSGRYILHM